MVKESRNGTIELLRFIFCMAVLFFHISMDIYGTDWRSAEWGGVMRYGALGVEFFFITSGYFMTNSINKKQGVSKTSAEETWTFLWNKLKPILPYHITFNLAAFAIGIIRGHTMEEHLNRLSCMLFLPTVGFNEQQWMLGAEWYIGYMLFGMLIIYPFLRRWRKLFIGYLAPVLTIILYGYMAYRYHTVMGSNRLIEAFADIMLGITVFSMSCNAEHFIDRISSRWLKWGIRLYPIFTTICFLAYMNTSFETDVQPFLVLLFASGLAVSFNRQGLLSRTSFFDNRVVYWLGKMSLPIYMVQNITRIIVQVIVRNKTALTMYILESVATIVCGIIGYYILNVFSAHARKSKA